jgi:hypothetical protein
VLKGEYLGLDTVALSQYAQWYNESRENCQKDVLLPALGGSISFTVLKGAKEYKGEFLGFDNHCILVRLMGAFNIITEKIDLSKLERITDKNGNLIDVGKLRNLSSEGKIPALSAVMVRTDSDTLHVPAATVGRIEIPNEKNAKWIGLGLGALIDLTLLYTFVSWYKPAN